MKEDRDILVKKIFTFMPLMHRKFFKGMHLKKVHAQNAIIRAYTRS